MKPFFLQDFIIIICQIIVLLKNHSLYAIISKYLRRCKDAYFILQNKYLHNYEHSFGAKIPNLEMIAPFMPVI